ncbi:hypothetical protein [Nonomuraea dietziae]|uniref:hypothetical protein n=1 Tax=Nonomuraea dietziae TaxID=65515 RepID=UPI0031E0C572
MVAASPSAMAQARAHQGRLTKPRSLGALEERRGAPGGIGAAGLSPPPMPEPAALAIFARRPRRPRPGGLAVAAGGHAADGRQLSLAGGAA